MLCAMTARTAGGADRAYRHSDGTTCDGWPRAPIGMAPGFCAGIVVAPPADFRARTLKFPRMLLQLGAA